MNRKHQLSSEEKSRKRETTFKKKGERAQLVCQMLGNTGPQLGKRPPGKDFIKHTKPSKKTNKSRSTPFF